MAVQGSGSAALLLVSVLSVLACSALAATHTVGDSAGWSQGTDYNAWASGKTFQKGDTLVFTYGLSHSALRVSQADYNACTTSNSLQSIPSGSSYTLTGSDAYFICGTPGHCIANGGAGGMNLAVKVSSTPSTPTTPGTPTTPTTPGTTPTTPTTPTSPGTDTTPTASAASGLQAATTLAVASMALIPLLL